jgi:catechol 2,3-dioxygenase-like lactoylglutathione lyase family enzyme
MLQHAPMYAYLPATDLARARRFYEEQLGFQPIDPEPHGVTYQFAGQTACYLYLTPNAGTSRASQAFWRVADVDREIAELKERGVTLEPYPMEGTRSPSGAITAGGAKTAWFKDTEGNILALVQPV